MICEVKGRDWEVRERVREGKMGRRNLKGDCNGNNCDVR